MSGSLKQINITSIKIPHPDRITPTSSPEAEIDRLDQVLKDNPEDGKTLFQLGQILVTKERYEEALGPLQKAARALPRNAEIQYLLGKAYCKLENYQEAMGPFNQALWLNPKCAKTHFGLCIINELVGDEETARQHYQIALKLNPNIEDEMD